MSYYTEGYVKSVGIRKGKSLAKADKLCIETVAPYKVLLYEKDFALFVAGDGEECVLNGNEERGAKIKGAASLTSVVCNAFDAQFLLVLKQNRSKVRFVFDNKLNALERIVVI